MGQNTPSYTNKHNVSLQYIVQFSKLLQAKIDFLKWYLSVNSSEIYGKFRVFRPKKIKKINFSLYQKYGQFLPIVSEYKFQNSEFSQI